jgi:hypothetical protein
MTILEFMRIVGFMLRALGALVFGVGAGWLVTHVLKWQLWQLAAAAVLGLMATFVLLGHWTDGGGAMGAFGLGAGGGLLVWGLLEERMEQASKPRRPTRR